jgi:hypothetical protein
MIRVPLSLADLGAELGSAGPSQRSSAGVAAAMRPDFEAQAARIPLASAASTCARSVRSQLNSGSVRPKCP